MSRKHNTKHPERIGGGYRRRLRKRGLITAPRMTRYAHADNRKEGRTP